MSHKKLQVQIARSSISVRFALLFILLFASVGSYFVFRSYAATNFGWCTVDRSGSYADGATIQAGMHICSSSDVAYTVTCSITMVPNGGNYTLLSPSSVTFNVPAGQGLRDIYVFTVQYRINSLSPHGFQVDCSGYTTLGVSMYSGPATEPDQDEDDEPAPRETGPPVRTPTRSSGSGQTSNTHQVGTSKTGTGTGGGSSGSAATKQGNKPNSTPSSSNQGNKNQTKQDPNPFYDGKQYQQGSESDKGVKGVFSKDNQSAVKLLPYISGLLLASGLGIWWWVRWRKSG